MKTGQEMLDMMRHAVGHAKLYRNHYNTEVGSEAYEAWIILVGLGLAQPGIVSNWGNDTQGGKQINFHVTDAGLRLLGYRKKKTTDPRYFEKKERRK